MRRFGCVFCVCADGSCSVGSTVANSMNLANNAVAETVITGDNNVAPAFKIEPSHQEAVYPYQVRRITRRPFISSQPLPPPRPTHDLSWNPVRAHAPRARAPLFDFPSFFSFFFFAFHIFLPRHCFISFITISYQNYIIVEN